MHDKRHGRIKFLVIGAIIFFLISGSVVANLQLSDLQIYSSDSGLKLDVIGKWLDLNNITSRWIYNVNSLNVSNNVSTGFLDVNNDANITGELTVSGHIDTNNINLNYLDVATMDNTSKMIQCSNGNRYIASFANLQIAFDLSANTSGGLTIYSPINIYTYSSPLYISGNTRFIGAGINKTIFRASNGANCTLFMSNGYANPGVVPTAENDNITLSDFTIDGNQYGSYRWTINDGSYSTPHGISLVWCNNSIIENVEIRNTLGTGLLWRCSNNNRIDNLNIYDIGCNYTGITAEALAHGINLQNIRNTSLSNIKINNIFADGIVLEWGKITTAYGNKPSEDIIISNFNINDIYSGIWTEGCQNSTINNGIITNATKTQAYDTEEPNGITIGSDDDNILVSNVEILNIGDRILGNQTGYYKWGTGIRLSGENTSVFNCLVANARGNGSYVDGNNNRIINCIIKNCLSVGILASKNDVDFNPIFNYNYICDVNDKGIYLNSPSTANYKANLFGSASYNHIYNVSIPVGNTEAYGIYCKLSNVSICENYIFNTYYGIGTVAGTTAYNNGININNNHVYNTTSMGIYLRYSGNGTCNNNILYDNVGSAIYLRNTFNYIVDGNSVSNCKSASFSIGEYDGTSCDYNIFTSNMVNNSVTTMQFKGIHSLYDNNLGYITEYSGVFFDADDGETVTHNLSVTPTGVIAICNMSGVTVAITAITSTTFTIDLTYHDGVARNDLIVYWYAFYKKDV